jgi:TRAP-type mannitol/chloroaromatic compound transport system substrate-binding protein
MAHVSKWDGLAKEVAEHVVNDCIDREGEETEEQVKAFVESRCRAVLTNIRVLALEEFSDDVFEAVQKRKEFIAAQVKARQAERKKAAAK